MPTPVTVKEIAEARGAKFKPRSGANIDADFYTELPQEPKAKWKGQGLSHGADIKKGSFDPCPFRLCNGNGVRLSEDTGHGRKSYKFCKCAGGKD